MGSGARESKEAGDEIYVFGYSGSGSGGGIQRPTGLVASGIRNDLRNCYGPDRGGNPRGQRGGEERRDWGGKDHENRSRRRLRDSRTYAGSLRHFGDHEQLFGIQDSRRGNGGQQGYRGCAPERGRPNDGGGSSGRRRNGGQHDDAGTFADRQFSGTGGPTQSYAKP